MRKHNSAHGAEEYTRVDEAVWYFREQVREQGRKLFAERKSQRLAFSSVKSVSLEGIGSIQSSKS